MPKFSIIVPVYNTETYLKSCLDSIFSQTYNDYETIIINDGSTDGSKNIINEYKKQYKNKMVVINQKNKGQSSARNNGIKYAKGEYILFVDSDDYIESDLLKTLALNILDNPDIVRFQVQEIKENKKIKYNEKTFETIDGVKGFEEIVKYHYIDVVWAYIFNKQYLVENNFLFSEGTHHEDFGLLPLALISASKIKSIDYIGYNYVFREGSIMNSNSYEKERKKSFDVLNHYLFLKKKNNNNIYRSFIANSAILKLKYLRGDDYKIYLNELIKNKVTDDLLKNTFFRRLKILIFKISPKFYLKFFC